MKRYMKTSYRSRVNRLAVLRKKYEQIDSSLIDKAFKQILLEELKYKIKALEYILG